MNYLRLRETWVGLDRRDLKNWNKKERLWIRVISLFDRIYHVLFKRKDVCILVFIPKHKYNDIVKTYDGWKFRYLGNNHFKILKRGYDRV